MKLNYTKLRSNAKDPVKKREGDAGFDLYAASIEHDTTKIDVATYSHHDVNPEFLGYETIETKIVKIKTGIGVEIPEGYVGLLMPRSSVVKRSAFLGNSIGVIDSGYRGELVAVFIVEHKDYTPYTIGERACQLVIVPCPEFELNEVKRLSATERGARGFGSTGTE